MINDAAFELLLVLSPIRLSIDFQWIGIWCMIVLEAVFLMSLASRLGSFGVQRPAANESSVADQILSHLRAAKALTDAARFREAESFLLSAMQLLEAAPAAHLTGLVWLGMAELRFAEGDHSNAFGLAGYAWKNLKDGADLKSAYKAISVQASAALMLGHVDSEDLLELEVTLGQQLLADSPAYLLHSMLRQCVFLSLSGKHVKLGIIEDRFKAVWGEWHLDDLEGGIL